MQKLGVLAVLVAGFFPWETNAQAPQLPLKVSIAQDTQIPHFPYPQQELLKYRDDQTSNGIIEIRKHAWSIFSALVAQREPQWERWYTKCDIPLDGACSKNHATSSNLIGLRDLEIPQQLKEGFVIPQNDRKNGQIFNIPGFVETFRADPSFAGVFFNPEAARSILSARINTMGTLEGMVQAQEQAGGTGEAPSIPPFPPDAIAVKTIWEQVIANPKSKVGTLHVWNPDMLKRVADPHTGGTLIGLTSDPTGIVHVDLDKSHSCDNKKDYNPNPIPIRCFYFKSIPTLAAYKEITPIAGILPQTQWSDPPFYMVLVAIHITTKEIPDWTWSTFYLSNTACSDPKCLDHPGSITGPWSRFVMDATLSADTPKNKDPEGPNVCYNPYLEGRMKNGVSSNCLFCHSHASYSTTPGERVSSTQIGSPPYFGGIRHISKNDETQFFQNAATTDFIWSLADMSSSSRLNEFDKELKLYSLSLNLK